MRIALLVAVLGVGGLEASAAPIDSALPSGALRVPAKPGLAIKPPIVWKNRVLEAAGPSDGVAAATTVSRKLYLNDCMPNGCVVGPGNDNSLTNRSSIAETTVTLSAYPHGKEHWDKLVACVQETFAPFTIEVVTADPGTQSHFEVMIGGSDTQLNPELSAGGVAPFVSCNAQRNNIISFVFPETTNDLEYLCGAVVQEASHVWGLDHELDAKDPMTYLELGSLKRFQNNDARCGEELNQPRNCRCGGQTQNSFRYMNNTFGLKPDLALPVLEITTPHEGQWVKPGFPIGARVTSPLDTVSAQMKIDSTVAGMMTTGPFVVNAPATVAPGPHVVAVSAKDAGDRTVAAMVNVKVMSSCASGESCEGGTHCLGGVCLPGSSVDGGLGATCEDSTQCVTGSCGSIDSESRCTASCDAGEVCPSGYDCVGAANGGGVCWPAESGGCNTGGSAPSFMLAGLAVLMLALRRRR